MIELRPKALDSMGMNNAASVLAGAVVDAIMEVADAVQLSGVFLQKHPKHRTIIGNYEK